MNQEDAGRTAAAVRELGTTQAPKPEDDIHCLTIVGQVEGHIVLPSQNKTTKYEHVIPQLLAVEQDPRIRGLLVLLNTVGGDVEAGLAIAETIRSLSKPTVSLVLGGGHSIGVPIAVATRFSFITETATMTIHPVRLSGLVIGVPQTYEYLDKMQERIIRFVVANSRISEQRFRELMFRTGELARDVGTVLVGAEAVREGIIDAVGGVREALAKLRELIALQQGVSGPWTRPDTARAAGPETRPPDRRPPQGWAPVGASPPPTAGPGWPPPPRPRG